MTKWCKDCLKTDHNTAECWGQGTIALPPVKPPIYIDWGVSLLSAPKTPQSLLDKLMGRVKKP